MTAKNNHEPSKEELQKVLEKFEENKLEILSDQRLVGNDKIQFFPELLTTPDLCALVLHISGKLTEETAPPAYEKFKEFADDTDRVIIGCAGITEIDAVGLSILIDMLAICKRTKKSFALINPSPMLEKKLKEASLDTIISIHHLQLPPEEEPPEQAQDQHTTQA